MDRLFYAGVVIIFLRSSTPLKEPARKFNKQLWLSDANRRYQMADDILDSQLFMEKDTNYLWQMLGNPTQRSDTAKLWIYDMGMGHAGFGVAFHSLNFKLANGKVEKVERTEIRD